jgi:hypothetical protein
MRRVVLALSVALTALVLLAVAAGPAGADPANKNTLSLTLNCGSLEGPSSPVTRPAGHRLDPHDG